MKFLRAKYSSCLLRVATSFVLAFLVCVYCPFPLQTPDVSAQAVLSLPEPGTMLGLSGAYQPVIMRGMTIHPENPLRLDFIMDNGEEELDDAAFKQESGKLIRYFLTALTVPDQELWVNLSPYEENRIIAEGLGKTEMGRDMLVQDYVLKQLTASLMYPEEELGASFWKQVREKIQARFGSVEVPSDTFNKIWIIPEKAMVDVYGDHVVIRDSHLKVMLEEDYLALDSNRGSTRHGLGDMTPDQLDFIRADAKEAIREVLIPEIEQEVNEGKHFANLRQIYHAIILAVWYKQNLKESLLGRSYADANKIQGLDLEDQQIKEKVYQRYLTAFEKGVYDYIREEYDEALQAMIPRRYFSGGQNFEGTRGAFTDSAELGRGSDKKALPDWKTRHVETELAVLSALADGTDRPFGADEASLSARQEEIIKHMMAKEEHALSDLKTWAEEELNADSDELLDFIREIGDQKKFILSDGRWTSFLEVLDEQGRPTGRIKSYWADWKPDEWRDIVGVLVFDDQGRLIAQQRGVKKQLDTSAAGQLDLNLFQLQGAKKELKEELGLEFPDDRFVPVEKVFRMQYLEHLPERGDFTGGGIFQMKNYHNPLSAHKHLYWLYLNKEESEQFYMTFRPNEEVSRVAPLTVQNLRERFEQESGRGLKDKQIQQGLTALLSTPGFFDLLDQQSQEAQRRSADQSDEAAVPEGIDFNPQNLELETRLQGAADMTRMNPGLMDRDIAGIVPVIVEISPILDLPVFLGQ